jgi:hypothetical protein
MKANNPLKISAMMALIFLLCSCSVLKHVKKDKEKTDTETQSKVDEITKTKTDTETKSKSLTTIEGDTSVHLAGKAVEGSAQVKDLEKRAVTFESWDGIQVTAIIDDGVLNLKAQTKPVDIPVKFKKTVYTEEQKKESKLQKTDSSAKVKTNTETQTKTSDKSVERHGIPWWLWIVAIIVLLGAAVYYLRKRGLL